MKSADIAAALVAGFQTQNNGNTDIGWHTGVVQSWDEGTGLNSILINGSTFNNLSVLSTSNSIMVTAGDTVALMRVQTQYFVLGRIQAPGAGAALQIKTGAVSTLQTSTSGTYGDLATVGPVVSNVYIGSSRRCLVWVGGRIQSSASVGYIAFQVSGASTIAPSDNNSAVFGDNNTAAVTHAGSVQQTILLTAADGLNQGFHVFTAKYKRTVTGTGTGADFAERRITVFPF